MDDGGFLAPLDIAFSEPQLRLELNHSCRHGGVEARTKNARGGLFPIENQPECRIGTPVIRRPKIGMIQYIETLKPERKRPAFPAWYFGVLHYSQIGIEIRRAAETVPPLRK